MRNRALCTENLYNNIKTTCVYLFNYLQIRHVTSGLGLVKTSQLLAQFANSAPLLLRNDMFYFTFPYLIFNKNIVHSAL